MGISITGLRGLRYLYHTLWGMGSPGQLVGGVYLLYPFTVYHAHPEGGWGVLASEQKLVTSHESPKDFFRTNRVCWSRCGECMDNILPSALTE